jgi:hypothetical protein
MARPQSGHCRLTRMVSDDEIRKARGRCSPPLSQEAMERVGQFRRQRHAIGRTLSETCEIASRLSAPLRCRGPDDRGCDPIGGEVRSDLRDGRPPFDVDWLLKTGASGRRNWAESAPTRVASETTGVRAKTAIPLRARNRLHCFGRRRETSSAGARTTWRRGPGPSIDGASLRRDIRELVAGLIHPLPLARLSKLRIRLWTVLLTVSTQRS